MKRTRESAIAALIEKYEREVASIERQKIEAVRFQDYEKAIVCRESIYHKTDFIEQLKKIL